MRLLLKLKRSGLNLSSWPALDGEAACGAAQVPR